MCLAGLQGAVLSPQVNQLTPGHRRWLWSAERYLALQLSLTSERNRILKPLGELSGNY